ITADNAVNSINSKTTEATEHVDSKVSEFNQTVLDNGFLTPQSFDEKLDELDWQKYKIINDDGMRIRVSDIDPAELDTGFYQIWKTYNMPPDTTDGSSAYWNVDVLAGVNDTKQILAVLSSNGKAYLKNIHKGHDNGWKELTTDISDTGWIPFNLINGAKTNSAYDYGGSRNGFGCAYRTIKHGNVTERHLRINGSNVEHNQVIAQLPPDFCKNVQIGFIRAPLAHNGTSIIVDRKSTRLNSSHVSIS